MDPDETPQYNITYTVSSPEYIELQCDHETTSGKHKMGVGGGGR